MATTFYIDAATQLVTSVQPDMTGRIELPVPLQDGLPFALVVPQLVTLQHQLDGLGEAVSQYVIRVTIGA